MKRRGLARPVMSLMKRFAPRHAEAAERESRQWMLVCPRCGLARSYWELGGIRYKAKGSPRVRLACPACGVPRWHRAERRTGDDPADR